MPSNMQRANSGRANYQASPLAVRNAALSRAASLLPVKVSVTGIQHLVQSGRTTTVLEYCETGEAFVAQVDKDREPYLLTEDIYNPGDFNKVSIYDCRIEALEKRSGKCWIHTAVGEMLVDGNTAVYWQ